MKKTIIFLFALLIFTNVYSNDKYERINMYINEFQDTLKKEILQPWINWVSYRYITSKTFDDFKNFDESDKQEQLKFFKNTNDFDSIINPLLKKYKLNDTIIAETFEANQCLNSKKSMIFFLHNLLYLSRADYDPWDNLRREHIKNIEYVYIFKRDLTSNQLNNILKLEFPDIDAETFYDDYSKEIKEEFNKREEKVLSLYTDFMYSMMKWDDYTKTKDFKKFRDWYLDRSYIKMGVFVVSLIY